MGNVGRKAIRNKRKINIVSETVLHPAVNGGSRPKKSIFQIQSNTTQEGQYYEL